MQNRKPESLVSGSGDTGIVYTPWTLKIILNQKYKKCELTMLTVHTSREEPC